MSLAGFFSITGKEGEISEGMAPGRRRGAKGVKIKNELSLGDLVLAKVKGFPAWPAKISRPEDWKHTPDPKKYFVQFFGTSEIAFVAPADIQAFTSESKNKLSTRCQGKTVKYFAEAVKQICEEFEVLQRKNSNGIRDDNNARNLASVTHSVDSMVDEYLDVSGDNEMDIEEPNCKLEIKVLNDLCPKQCSQRMGEVECQDMKRRSSDDIDHSLSPHLSSGMRNKLSTNLTNLVKESVLGSSPSSHSLLRAENSRDVKVEGWHPNCSQSTLTNGHQMKLAMGMKMKHDGAIHRNSNSVISHEHRGEGLQIKDASDSNMKVSDSNMKVSTVSILRSDLDTGSGRKAKKLLKDKKHSEAVDEGRMDDEVIFEDHNEVISRKEMKIQHDRENQTSQANDASFSFKLDNTESKRLASSGKAENQPSKAQPSSNKTNHFIDEDDLPPIKRHRRALEVMSSSTLISENRLGNSVSHKNGLVHSNIIQSPIAQLPMKRRAVRLNDDGDELPKTPIHVGFTHKVSVIPYMSDSKRKNVMLEKSYADGQLIMRNFGRVEDKLKEHVDSSASSSNAHQSVRRTTTDSLSLHVSPRQPQLDTENISFTEAKPVIVSPKRSPHSVSATGPLAEPQKKHFSKVSDSISPKKVPLGANRGLATASNMLTSSLSQSISERSKPTTSGEKKKTTMKSDSQINDPVPLARNPDEKMTSFGERLDVTKDAKTSFPVDLAISDSGMSMKHLIAAAQARKRQASLKHLYGNPLQLIPDADLRRSPSLFLATSAVESSNSLQINVQSRPTSPSPSYDACHFSSVNDHENEDLEERRVSSGHQATGSCLSGDTETAVARDAFEGMIETLSRTKESIGRATRLAIDCAKYGIANEVVELLIQKLESEPSFHRKIDLFFLVDSVTQCSHSQKGIAGASYIPIVQAALPRLIGAAAPSGLGAQENRRQCHKVLRLWLERKILPESVLRHYMDDIGATNDGSSAGFSQRRPSRAERAIDDPIREMEGLLVDEYGSNATFQLPGLLSSHLFEEEDEDEDIFPTKLCKEVMNSSPCEHSPASKDLENYTATPSDRRHCILEDVDGELEMEDVYGHPKDECSNVIFESASNMFEVLPSPEGSPPLPPGSPPVTPPLPTSPPPLSPALPPLPISPPSPPPPPPPPPPSSEHQLFPPPPVDSPLFPQSLPPHTAFMPLHMPPLPSTMSTSQPLAYYPPPLHHEIGATPTGNQSTHMVSNTQGSHISAPIGGEVFSQQSSFFSPVGASNAREHVSYNSSRLVEYGHGNTCMNPQALQQRQQFLPGSAPFAQRPSHPEPSHFSYPNPVQHHQYQTYSLPNLSDGSRTYTDEQWRMPVSDFNADHPHRGWMTGGYFGPPSERAPASAVTFQSSSANNLPAALMSVHGVPIMPCRPDISAVNWRPV